MERCSISYDKMSVAIAHVANTLRTAVKNMTAEAEQWRARARSAWDEADSKRWMADGGSEPCVRGERRTS